ncbi:hypothetical protein BC833DRAFT_625377 [Globomyces pollinis-pini]|nr:hypothetical protein BC833DRAFT_625377 [Globomyces pollinis-pini]
MLDYQTATHNYIGSPDVIQDWTTWDNTAEFAAFALLDLNPTPNSFCIAGVQVTANDITSICSSATGVKWTSHQLLPLWALKHVIGVLKVFVSGRGSTLPIWQKLQYGYVQAKGECAHTSLDNHFYNVKWTGLTPLVKKEYIGSKAKGPAPAKKSGYGFPIAIAGVSLIGGAYYFRNQLRDLV